MAVFSKLNHLSKVSAIAFFSFMPLLILACGKPFTPIALANRQPLPLAFQTKILERMAQSSLLNQETLRITQSTRTTWSDCLHPNAEQLLEPSCKAVQRSGWKVEVQGQTEVWTYYVTDSGIPILDAPASLNPKVKTALGRSGLNSLKDLHTIAAEPYAIADTSHCPTVALCKVRPTPGWKVAVSHSPRLFYLDYQGKPMPVGDFRGLLPRNLKGLPTAAATAAIRDVQDRHGVLPANFRVESIQPLSWELCGGGPGPTQPERGTCPVGLSIPGWRLQAMGAGMHWIYYWPKGMETDAGANTLPDGLQSLPKTVSDRVLQTVARGDRLPRDQYYIRRASAIFLDRCLNRKTTALHCRQGIQSGWSISIMGGKPLDPAHPSMESIATYTTSLDGSDVTLVDRRIWAAVP
jgi:hypothetical protein